MKLDKGAKGGFGKQMSMMVVFGGGWQLSRV